MVFLLARGCEPAELADRVHGARVRRFASERDMLLAWRTHVQQQDPDAFALFEVHNQFCFQCVFVQPCAGSVLLLQTAGSRASTTLLQQQGGYGPAVLARR